jgi:CheY-like chemotaxis protein
VGRPDCGVQEQRHNRCATALPSGIDSCACSASLREAPRGRPCVSPARPRAGRAGAADPDHGDRDEQGDHRDPGADGEGQLAAVRVVILTNYGLDEYVFRALRAGASGFLLKDTEPADLLQALRAATRCCPPRSPGS